MLSTTWWEDFRPTLCPPWSTQPTIPFSSSITPSVTKSGLSGRSFRRGDICPTTELTVLSTLWQNQWNLSALTASTSTSLLSMWFYLIKSYFCLHIVTVTTFVINNKKQIFPVVSETDLLCHKLVQLIIFLDQNFFFIFWSIYLIFMTF